jgi:hypothetical protein
MTGDAWREVWTVYAYELEPGERQLREWAIPEAAVADFLGGERYASDQDNYPLSEVDRERLSALAGVSLDINDARYFLQRESVRSESREDFPQ